MSARDLFVGVSLICIGNGFLSPALLLLFPLAPLWMPGFVPVTQGTALFASSLLVSFGTLLLSGIPAALFERLSGRGETDRVSMLIWLAGAVVLFLPAVPRLALLL
jgi:hypothetical protein